MDDPSMAGEKKANLHASPIDIPTSRDVNANADEAYIFLKKTHGDGAISDHDLRVLRHRVDWRFMPLMFLIYMMNFLDKLLINYGAVMGMTTDLELKGNDLSNASSAFFIAFLISEPIYSFVLNKISPARTMAFTIIIWGITTACMAAVHDYRTLVCARVFLGFFEGAVAPGLCLVISQWYTKSEQALRFSYWFTGVGAGQILGSILSFAFQHVHTEVASWRILFIVCGVLTIFLGVGCLVVIPTSPMTAKFLSDEEKAALLRHVSSNKTGVLFRHIKLSQLKEMFLDPQIWLLMLATLCTTVTSGVVSTYSSTLIKNMGFKPTLAALLTAPSGVVTITSIFITGFGIRKYGNRWLLFVICCIPGIIGGALMSFLPRQNRAGIIVGIYLINAVVAVLPNIFGWAAANVAGHTKRPASLALINACYGVGSIIGPQTFQARNAPVYLPAKITVLATQAAGAVCAVFLFVYYRWANHRRGPVTSVNDVSQESEEQKWLNLTDKENASFRYVS